MQIIQKKIQTKQYCLIAAVILLSIALILAGELVKKDKDSSKNINKGSSASSKQLIEQSGISKQPETSNLPVRSIDPIQPTQPFEPIEPKRVQIYGPLVVPIAEGYHEARQNHKHKGLTFNYPTLGIPIVGNTFNTTQVSDKDLAQFDDQVNRLFKPYNDTDCQFVRYGDVNPNGGGEGGYVICKNFLYKSEAIINIGINGFDDFGCKVSTVGQIPNYQYDCTNPTGTYCATNNGLNKMNNICLGAVTEKAPAMTFFTVEDIVKVHELENKHYFLKIDCQGCEYPGLKYFPVEKLEYIDQIAGEIHLGQIYKEEWGMLDIFRTLIDKFVMVNLHMTNWECRNTPTRHLKSTAIEFNLVNKKLITLKSQSQSYTNHPLNKPAGYDRADCQMTDGQTPPPK